MSLAAAALDLATGPAARALAVAVASALLQSACLALLGRASPPPGSESRRRRPLTGRRSGPPRAGRARAVLRRPRAPREYRPRGAAGRSTRHGRGD